MAFANRLGNIFKNAVNYTPSIYQSVRCMSSSKLFVGGVSYNTDDYSLKEAFESYGEVVEARIIIDRDSGRSKGFGFVTYTSADHASAAINAMDGKELHGRVVRVNYANDRGSGFRSGGGGGGAYGGGGGGNYNSRDGGYGSGSSNSYGGGDVNFSVAGGGDDSFLGGGGGGGGYAGNDSGPNFSGGSTGTYGSNTSVGGSTGTYGSNTSVGGYGKEDDGLLDETKDGDFEPDDYATKQS